MYIMNYRLYVELTFNVERSNKLMQAVSIILIQFLDRLNRLEPEAKIVKYKVEIKKINAGVVVDKNDIMKEVPSFIRFMREYFHNICTKGKSGERVYMKL